DVLHRDGVAQRLSSQQDVRVAGQVGGDLLHPEGGGRHNRYSRRIFVVELRTGRAVDVGVVAPGEGRAIGEAAPCLVGDDRAVGDPRLECDVELDQGLAVDRQIQITNVDDTGTSKATRAAGGADVRAGRVRDQRERAGREIRLWIASVHVVEY